MRYWNKFVDENSKVEVDLLRVDPQIEVEQVDRLKAFKANLINPGPIRTRMRAKASPSQRFVVSHHREEDFEGGLRRYAKYRDLGIAQATNGMVRAHVIRFVPPCRPEEVSKRHYHDVDFQMVYVLKGWIKSEFDGQGAIVMRAGS